MRNCKVNHFLGFQYPNFMNPFEEEGVPPQFRKGFFWAEGFSVKGGCNPKSDKKSLLIFGPKAPFFLPLFIHY